MIAKTPSPPYYAVIFTSVKAVNDANYQSMANHMLSLAQNQPGFLGIESAEQEIGITVSYWSDLQAIKNWKENAEHQVAQKTGKEKWYAAYKTRIAKIERDYDFNK